MLQQDKFLEIDVEQGSQEWLDLRKKYIGASDAPIIMGVSPWTTPYKLWEQKLGLCPTVQENEAMKRGKRLEPIAREIVENQVGYKLKPTVAISTSHPWMLASFDGIDHDSKCVVEIKCPGHKDHDIAMNGFIPDKYIPQLIHQMCVASVNTIYYFSYSETSHKLIRFDLIDTDLQALLFAEKLFWDGLQNLEAPQLTDRDYNYKDFPEWKRACSEWKMAKDLIKISEQHEKEWRQILIGLSENKNCRGSGVKTQKILRKGQVDYGLVPELIAVDLEPYRKPKVESWRITSE